MTTPIANGTYHIQNVQFPNTYLDLAEGLPYALLDAWSSSSSTNLKWIVNNVGNNQITIENVTARGYYAGVTYYIKGSPVFASPNLTRWTVKQVSSGKYNIELSDGLQLTQRRDGESASIFLGPLNSSSAPERGQWTFKAVS